MTDRRFPLAIIILLGLYLAAGGFALAVALWDPAGDSLSAIYLVLVAVPWTFVLGWITDSLELDSYWFNMSFLATGILVNVFLLFGLGRLIQRMGKR
jgi:hypothetical protein